MKSEFIANQDIEVHIKDKQPSPNIEGAELVKIKKGEAIPKIFIPKFLRKNRNFIENLEYKNGLPVLTENQEKEYGVVFKVEKKPLKIEKDKYTQEKLTQKMNSLGKKKFKDWADKTFPELDKRKNANALIVDILRIQEENRR